MPRPRIAAPTNSALLYLLGRICLDPVRARALFSQARQADEKNPYPLYAIAYDEMLNGNWPEAKTHLEQVLALRVQEIVALLRLLVLLPGLWIHRSERFDPRGFVADNWRALR